ncbi:MAG: electron transporter RnfD [Ruminococcus sp.]|nr:electron transporter RnfD [Ruminococcus sp.]
MAEKFIPFNSSAVTIMGRTDNPTGEAERIVFAGTQITVRFVGTKLAAVLCNHKFYNKMELGVLVDGLEKKVEIPENDKRISVTLCEGLDRGEHEITLFKRQDATHYFDFFGFETDENAELLDPLPLPELKIECYGDSVSAGAVCEAVDHVASPDPDNTDGVYDNAYHSYPMITARNLGAQIHNIAQGGISIFDRTGYYHAPETIGMETAYDKVCYFPEAEGGYSAWDFEKYTPDIVILAVGQNDQHREQGDDPDITDPKYRRKWKERYKEIILDLRGHYPKARFVMLLTVLMHDPTWDDALDEIVEELGGEWIEHFRFKRCGKATPGHPRLQEQYEMASELTAYLVKTKLK